MLLGACLPMAIVGYFSAIAQARVAASGVSAVRTGLEPVTPCVTGMYSNQLN